MLISIIVGTIICVLGLAGVAKGVRVYRKRKRVKEIKALVERISKKRQDFSSLKFVKEEGSEKWVVPVRVCTGVKKKSVGKQKPLKKVKKLKKVK